MASSPNIILQMELRRELYNIYYVKWQLRNQIIFGVNDVVSHTLHADMVLSEADIQLIPTFGKRAEMGNCTDCISTGSKCFVLESE